MLALAPGERQLIRVIRTSPPSASVEEAYRLSIDELPPAKLQKNKLQFVMHYSVPVFIQPTTQADTAAKLQWKLQQRDGKQYNAPYIATVQSFPGNILARTADRQRGIHHRRRFSVWNRNMIFKAG